MSTTITRGKGSVQRRDEPKIDVSIDVYVCIYIYICIHVCMHVCLLVCLYVYLQACMHVCMSACLSVCMYEWCAPNDILFPRVQAEAWTEYWQRQGFTSLNNSPL